MPLSATPLPLPPAEERIVISYDGVQLIDAREHIKVRFTNPPKIGVRYFLRDAGFRPLSENVWSRLSNPEAIFRAQETLTTFYGDEQ